jgi:hypothetical protein
MGKPSLLRRLTLCKMKLCPHRAGSDDTHLWGECVNCGQRVAVISRAAVRRYIEAQERAALARAQETSR